MRKPALFILLATQLTQLACGRLGFDPAGDGGAGDGAARADGNLNDGQLPDGPMPDASNIVNHDFDFTNNGDCASAKLIRLGQAVCTPNGLRLSQDTANSQGGVALQVPLSFNATSDLDIRWSATISAAATPADGMALILHNDSRGALAFGTGDMALGGVVPSRAFEIDTYVDTYDPGPAPHLSVVTDGNFMAASAFMASPIAIATGVQFNVRYRYKAAEASVEVTVYRGTEPGASWSYSENFGNQTRYVALFGGGSEFFFSQVLLHDLRVELN